ncbi:MAG: hypothetical protein J6I79_09660 [Paludibacteraceae bacterium]|nr:hypothetical protein [Paludibacteraceae bacterium]
MEQQKIIKILKYVFCIAFAISCINFGKQKQDEKILMDKMDARFAKFTEMLFPYIERYSQDAELLRRMQISCMIDYYQTQKDRYIHEYVQFYDSPGKFCLRDKFKIEKEMDHFSH